MRISTKLVSKIMSDQLKTRKASDLKAAQGSNDANYSVQSPKKIKFEPCMLLQMFNALLILKITHENHSLFAEIFNRDMYELDEAIKWSVIAHDNFWCSFGYSLLENAVEAGLTSVVKLLLKHADTDIAILINEGCQLLVSCMRGYIEITQLLLEHGADPNLSGKGRFSNKTCLSVACTGANSSLAALLLKYGANPNFCCLTAAPLLLEAISNSKIDIVKLLLEHGADANVTSPDQNTPIASACFEGYLEVATLLLDYGADINAVDKDGDTPLLLAVRGRRPDKDLVQLLLERGADISLLNNEGCTALQYTDKGSELAQMIINAQLEPILK